MRANNYLKVLFVLTVLTLCLPWFTINAKMMDGCCGYAFMKQFLVPAATIGICLFYPKRQALLILLAEVSLVGCFFVLAYAFGFWQEVCNIRSGAQWQDGFHTAQPGFWVSVCFFVLFFILSLIHI